MDLEEITLGVDMNGGDWIRGSHPSEVITQGLRMFRERYPSINLQLFGDEVEINHNLKRYGIPTEGIMVSDFPGYYVNNRPAGLDNSMSAKEKKKQTSLIGMLDALNEEEIQCAYSLGDTGSLIAHATREIGFIRGLFRITKGKYPPLIAEVPKLDGSNFLFLDVGANVDVSGRRLLKYGELADSYARKALDIDDPRIAALSNGTETFKGNHTVKELERHMKRHNDHHEPALNYVGYIEGKTGHGRYGRRGFFEEDIDIVLADGFVGNTNTKTMEGLIETIYKKVKHEKDDIVKDGTIREKIGLALGYLSMWMLQGRLKRVESEFHPDYRNAAPLLGLDAPIMKGHGNSSPRGVYHGLIRTLEYHQSGAIQHMRDRFSKKGVDYNETQRS